MIDDLLCSFKCLRVLSLSNHEARNVVSDSIGNLKHLRYLNLERSKIKCLPDFVCALYNLQTLLYACRVAKQHGETSQFTLPRCNLHMVGRDAIGNG